MKTYLKSPHEIAAQAVENRPYYWDPFLLEDGEMSRLNRAAGNALSDLQATDRYFAGDDDLSFLNQKAESEARAAGLWDATTGQGAEDRVRHLVERGVEYGFSEEEATRTALQELRKLGYLDRLRSQRKELEDAFKVPITDYIKERSSIEHTTGTKHNTPPIINLSELNPEHKAAVKTNFPTGNFLYHGAKTEQLLSILQDGFIITTSELKQQEQERAVQAGREPNAVPSNSGLEGISWSMNRIDALPGDRYHLAGFVTSPEMILGQKEQLCVPSRPAPYEVLQMPVAVNAAEFFSAKTQLELYQDVSCYGESNSVIGGLLAACNEDGMSKLHQEAEKIEIDTSRVGLLRELAFVDEQHNIELYPSLLQQSKDEISVAAVWLQAMIDNGMLADTKFAGLDLVGVVKAYEDGDQKLLAPYVWRQTKKQEAIVSAGLAEGSQAPRAAVEDMYFVTPQKDAKLWEQVLALSPHKPKGILIYDDKQVRMENFASGHRGDHSSLTAQLQRAINPAQEGYISYDDVLGVPFSDAVRTGSSHHVIAEHHLDKRKKITNDGGKLLIS